MILYKQGYYKLKESQMAKVGFLNENRNHESSIPLRDDRFGNSICFGATGSGKTTSYISINLANAIEEGRGVLLFDFKGNLHLKAKVISTQKNKLDKVIEIGKPWSTHINLLEYCDVKSLEEYIIEFSRSSSDPFWSNSAVSLITAVFEIMQINKNIVENLNIDADIAKNIHYGYSFRLLHSTISNIETIKKFLYGQEILLKKIEFFYHRANMREQSLSMYYHSKLSSVLKSLESYKTYSKENNDGSGLSGVIISASSTLQGLAKDEHLNRKELDIVKKLEEGFLVIVNSANLNSHIVSIIHKGITSNLLKRAHKNSSTPISIFIDEAHQVLSLSTIPETSVCRENRFEYFLATQDISSLRNAFNNDSIVDELLSNIHQQLEFKAENIKKNPNDGFVYEDIKNKKWGSVVPMLIDKDMEIDAEIEFQTINQIKERFLLDEICEEGYLEYDRDLMTREGKVFYKQRDGKN